jgi:hypothetical protein
VTTKYTEVLTSETLFINEATAPLISEVKVKVVLCSSCHQIQIETPSAEAIPTLPISIGKRDGRPENPGQRRRTVPWAAIETERPLESAIMSSL